MVDELPQPRLGLPTAAYVHVPFCRHRCGYCNFTLIAGRDDLQPAYLDALERELALLERPREVTTLFVGGGTPTQLEPRMLERLLSMLQDWLPIAPNSAGEFSVEANPNDLTDEKGALLQAFGVNRISLGVQSFQPHLLRTLERDHTPDGAREAVQRAKSWFPDVSLDLIFAVPQSSLADWQRDLEATIELQVQHVSTYGLTYEKGAAFWGRLNNNQIASVDEETERLMYLEAIARLDQSGWLHYEVSNFARNGHVCRHNVNYWRGGEYHAFGPGAARHVDGRRETNHRSVTTYIRRMLAGQSPVAETEQLSPQEQAKDKLVFGLRMREGVNREWFLQSTGIALDEVAGNALRTHIEQGRLEDTGAAVRLTTEGLLVSDSVLVDFI